jgi:hypothetical protein
MENLGKDDYLTFEEIIARGDGELEWKGRTINWALSERFTEVSWE